MNKIPKSLLISLAIASTPGYATIVCPELTPEFIVSRYLTNPRTREITMGGVEWNIEQLALDLLGHNNQVPPHTSLSSIGKVQNVNDHAACVYEIKVILSNGHAVKATRSVYSTTPICAEMPKACKN